MFDLMKVCHHGQFIWSGCSDHVVRVKDFRNAKIFKPIECLDIRKTEITNHNFKFNIGHVVQTK